MGNESNDQMFFQDLILLDKNFQDTNQFFDFTFPILKSGGYVNHSFLDAIKQRESSFPTALPTEPYVVAMPHTDVEHVIRPFIFFTRAKETIPWREMANNDHVLKANFVFLLGFNQKDGHIDLLQKLMSCFVNSRFLEELYHAKTEHEIFTLLTSNINL
ncbi:PTS sugar transporter subunit IIA [Gilliamella sp. ESL0250]|uniref:PTS sugar transporter subunit IIA n=1 Tax=Gilliamella sp. ESL0250 TaxID=2705036 RepID=UPI0015804E4B|nr:PTS sugar transporter subunit IIA [Gilliamella sp. ESL0250]NUF49635.1 PTS sugar transporter subunit IIA [Gilliamella sp. ESL0250]